MINGYSVPSRIEAAATTSSTLLPSKADSRDIRSNEPPRPIFGARHA